MLQCCGCPAGKKKGLGVQKKVLAKKGLQGEVKKKGIGGEKKGEPEMGGNTPLS